MHDKEGCGCSEEMFGAHEHEGACEECGCHHEAHEGHEGCMGKVHLRHLLMPLMNELPEDIKDMLHSLDTQKLAVLKELKTWADENGHDELAEGCEKKIAKITKRLDEEN